MGNYGIIIFTLILSFIPTLGFCEPSPKSLGKSGAFEAFTLGDGADQICFMVGTPKNKKDGDLPLMITHHPKEKHMSVVSFALPDKVKEEKDLDVSATVKLKDKSQNFVLKHEGDHAWTTDETMDKDLSELLTSKGSEVILQVNTHTKIAYSLKGASKAYDTINNACAPIIAQETKPADIKVSDSLPEVKATAEISTIK